MEAKNDHDEAKDDEEQRIADIAVPARSKGAVIKEYPFGKGGTGPHRGGHDSWCQNMEESPKKESRNARV